MKELSAGVTDNVGALNRVLTNVKARGTWAEVQLETILDQTIPNMYEKNIATGEKIRNAWNLPFAFRRATTNRALPICRWTRNSRWKTMCGCARRRTTPTPTR